MYGGEGGGWGDELTRMKILTKSNNQLGASVLSYLVNVLINLMVYSNITSYKMRDERKKQARSNKQTRQSNTAHMYVYMP